MAAIPDWQAKDKLEARRLNEMVRGINSVFPLTGGAGITTTSGVGGGSSVALDPNVTTYYTPILCKITNAGPASESDFTDYRYWCQVLQNVNTTTQNTTESELDVQDKAYGEKIIAAFNLAEYVDESHGLAVGDYVIVLPVRFDKGALAEPVVRYIIVQGGGSLPTPQYQYMVLQAVSNNQLGADWVRAHDLL